MPRLSLCALGAVLALAVPGFGHEFWIEPQEYQVESGAPLVASLLNGQEFSGNEQVYFPNRTARFELIRDGDATRYAGRMGDVPALQGTAPGDGLLVIVHQTEPSSLKYNDWKTFQAFVDHKGFGDIRSRHLARGLPESGFRETYTRYAKALVSVGSGEGRDIETGMETEFVAVSNPYTDELNEGLDLLLLYRGAPRADAQVEIFERAPDGTVTIRLTRTDTGGRARIAVSPGHAYLLDAVILRDMPDGSDAVWESLWAALTFAVPER